MRSAARINLCFHGIGMPQRALEPGEQPYWLSKELFTQILEYVGGRENVALSFDDGNASDVEIALPELTRRGLRASFFPIASRIGESGSIDAIGLRRLLNSGMTVGSHGMNHVRWRGLRGPGLDEELVVARAIIEREAGAPITAAACPFGVYDRRALSRLRALSYAQVFTSDRAPAHRGWWLQPRFSLRQTDTLAEVRQIVEQTLAPKERMLHLARIAAKRWR